MEDSVDEEERREQGETVAQAAKARHGGVEASGGGEPAEGGGFLSAVASKVGATMSGANGSGSEVNATAASDGEEGKRDGNSEPGEEGGFLSAVASKIGAAMSGANGGGGDNGGDGGGNATVASNGEGKEKEDGNGSGGIFHKLLSSSPLASSPASGAMEIEEVKGEEKDQGVAGEQAGILSSMASKIGMAMSGASGNGDHSSEDDAKTSNGEAVDGSKDNKEKGDEASGGGILSTMASKIGMAMSGANGDGNHGASGVHAKTSNGEAAHDSKGEEKEGDEANGGGILSTVASKIGMAMAGTNGNEHRNREDDAKTSNGDAVHGSKGEEKGGEANGGGIVEQIISNLPSDDQAPDADEASLLIAIIED